MRDIRIDHFHKGLLSEVDSKANKSLEKWRKVFPNCSKGESIILENTQRYLTEANSTSDMAGYDGFVLNLARRSFSKSIAKDIVSIQPMVSPVSKVFYMDPEITSGLTHESFIDQHTSMRGYSNWDSSRGLYSYLSGATTALTASQLFSGSTSVIPYSGGQEGLSALQLLEQTVGSTVSGTNIAFSGYGGLISAAISPTGTTTLNPVSLSFDNDINTGGFWFNGSGLTSASITREFSASTIVNRYRFSPGGGNPGAAPTAWSLSGITGVSGSWTLIDSDTKTNWDASTNLWFDKTLSNTTPYLAYALNITGFASPITLSVAEIQFYNQTTTVGGNFKTNFIMSPQNWTHNLLSGNQISVIISGRTAGSTGSTYFTEWKSYATQEGESEVQRIKLNVSSATIEAKTRKLKSKYTDEASQNLESYLSLNLENELVELMSTEIALEIDREIIMSLINIAPYKSEWFYDQSTLANVPGTYFYSGDQRELTGITLSGSPMDSIAQDALWVKINQMDGTIRKANIYHGANFIVCSTAVGVMIKGMTEFSSEYVGEIIDSEAISCVGKLGSRFKVYIDPYLPRNILLMGYKGDGWDAGYIHAPYTTAIPNVVRDPDELFTITKGFMSRYANKVISNTKYGVINCTFPSTGAYVIVNEEL